MPCVIHIQLVDGQKIFLPPLHIKLGLVKHFVKAMDEKAMVFSI